ncbi:GIY-YIG nuclease family protein [Flexivirga alba]|uniref:GIY-YIG nuclease family protein n=1 Tax=Flexivirga alba TaxID=702742 RepID=A0ABW2AIS8_9MICO
MTRRLEPMDRVRELGGASVPFPFDVHILYFPDDAVTLEAQLHQAFAGRKLNNVNLRREFFFATPAEVKAELEKNVGSLLEYVDATSLGTVPAKPRYLGGQERETFRQRDIARSDPRDELGRRTPDPTWPNKITVLHLFETHSTSCVIPPRTIDRHGDLLALCVRR